MVKKTVDIGVFEHAESKSGLHFELNLLLQGVFATFWSDHMAVFHPKVSFTAKLGSQIFRNIRPCNILLKLLFSFTVA